MKKRFFLILATLSLLAIVFGCSQNTKSGYTPSTPEAKKYTVTFVANSPDVTGEMRGQTFTESVPQNLSTNQFILNGYILDGWALTSTGDKVYEDGEKITITENTMLFAVWKKLLIRYMGKDDNKTGTVTYNFYFYDCDKCIVKTSTRTTAGTNTNSNQLTYTGDATAEGNIAIKQGKKTLQGTITINTEGKKVMALTLGSETVTCTEQ